MGITDEDYAKALKLQRAFELQQMKIEARKQKEEAKMAGLMNSLGNLIGGGGNGYGGGGGGMYQQAQQAQMNPHHQQAAQQAGTGTVHISHGGTTTTFTGGGGGGGSLQFNTSSGTWGSVVNTPTVKEKDLKHDAMVAPLSALVDMWTMRWQGTWVNEAEFDEDDFWRLALVRLLGANKLEKHNLADQYRSVYRIIE